MRTLIARLSLASMLAAGTAVAQSFPFNEVGVTMASDVISAGVALTRAA
jgi:hypothetical protein